MTTWVHVDLDGEVFLLSEGVELLLWVHKLTVGELLPIEVWIISD